MIETLSLLFSPLEPQLALSALLPITIAQSIIVRIEGESTVPLLLVRPHSICKYAAW